MTRPAQHCALFLGSSLRIAAFATAAICALTVVTTQSAEAQTFTVLHNFSGADGARPWAGLTLDAGGNLYGTTSAGGYTGAGCGSYAGCGTVFRLEPGGSGWILSPLYSFHNNDGAAPYAGVILGPDGTLYGTTSLGGSQGDGVVFNLRPPATVCRAALCPWAESVLWNFMGGNDGVEPGNGDLIFDNAGHVYGTTEDGGNYGAGTVFELTKLPEGGWSENIDYSFGHLSSGGSQPYDGVIFDANGNMYTTTTMGGPADCGTVSELVNSPSGWTENVLHTFTCEGDGGYPSGGLIFDEEGNLYGTTSYGGLDAGGTVFELTPSDGGWTFNTLYDPAGFIGSVCGPEASLTMDAAGNLYGTASADGAYAAGSVFKLTRSDGGWTYSSLHEFTGGSDGAAPFGSVIFDANGNLYGTASGGGAYNHGTVWEIAP